MAVANGTVALRQLSQGGGGGTYPAELMSPAMIEKDSIPISTIEVISFLIGVIL